MSYLDTNTRTTKVKDNEQFKQLGRFPAHFGVFLGIVKRADDVQRNGRLQVWIPEFGSAPTEEQGWITVNYCSPFAGATNVETISKTDLESFDKTQTSYGMWMVPPDVNNQVLVMFVGGDPARGIWIGSLYNQFMNNMVPGVPSDAKSWQHPGVKVPAAEYNKWDKKVTQPDRAFKPYEKTKFKGVGNQGLIKDEGRGINSSGARRESPSTVFGILTPGPIIDNTAKPESIRRKGGSSFIMDDGDGSEYIELSTKSGAKIKIDETNGFIYAINRDGTSWIQMDQKGNVDIFSQADISLRSMKNVNIRADKDVNIEAGQNIYMSAAKDTKSSGNKAITYDINNKPKSLNVEWYAKCARGQGDGGNIIFEARNDMHTTVQKNLFVTTLEGTQQYKSKKDIELYTDQNYNLNAVQEIRLKAGSTYGVKAPLIIEEGPVKIKNTLTVELATVLGNSLDVNLGITGTSLSLSGDIVAGTILGTFPRLMGGPGAQNGGPGANGPSVSNPPAPTPVDAGLAELKGLVEAGDILPKIADPYFTRPMQGWPTIVSRWPTYEPCPLHEEFKFGTTTGYTPTQTEGDKTYNGSSGAGNEASTSPPPNIDQGSQNKVIPPPDKTDSIVTKDLNMKALECQLKKHEGVKYVSYNDSLGLPTAGIGHLLRTNEISQYPVPTPVSEEQVSAWFQQDASTCIKDAQNFVGMDCWSQLSDNRKRALADLAYNMGGARLGKFVSFKAAMKSGDYDAAGASLKSSKWFTQVASRGPKIISQIVNDVDPNGCDKSFTT